MIGSRAFFFAPVLLFSILTPLFLPSSSVSLSYFILSVPMSECTPFPIAYWMVLLFSRNGMTEMVEVILLCAMILVTLCLMVWDWRVSRAEPMLSCRHDLLFIFWLLLFYLFLPSMGWLCGVGVFELIECSHSLPALHSWLQMIIIIIKSLLSKHNSNNNNNNNNKFCLCVIKLIFLIFIAFVTRHDKKHVVCFDITWLINTFLLVSGFTIMNE